MLDWLINRVASRKYDFAIGGDENPYCLRWWVIPRNRYFNIYLHLFMRDDDDRALHTHPWLNCSIPLTNGYLEQSFRWQPRAGWMLPATQVKPRTVGRMVLRRPRTPHRVILYRDMNNKPIRAWSLFLTGPVWREWGFLCSGGRFVHWKDFTDPTNYGKIGKGCGE